MCIRDRLQSCPLSRHQMSSTSNTLTFVKRGFPTISSTEASLVLPKVKGPKSTALYFTTLDDTIIRVPLDTWLITRDIVPGPQVARFCTTFWTEKPIENWVQVYGLKGVKHTSCFKGLLQWNKQRPLYKFVETSHSRTHYNKAFPWTPT